MSVEFKEIQNEMAQVEECIRSNIKSKNSLLEQISLDVVQSGGKRLRPAFTILASKFGKKQGENIIRAASAIEILHTATLVHDDIVDRAKMRRGRLTVSEEYGVDMAVYTGDFLFTKAVLMLSKDIETDKLDILAKGIKSICEGEVDQFLGRFNTELSVLSYLKRINRKTAFLFGSACALGAGLSKCPENISRKLIRFGINFGMAFQIRADINDYAQDEKTTGKTTNNDIVRGVITLPVIYAMENCKDIKDKILAIPHEKGREWDFASEIRELVIKNGGIDRSAKVLEKYIERGLDVLGSLPVNVYRDRYESLIKSLGVAD